MSYLYKQSNLRILRASVVAIAGGLLFGATARAAIIQFSSTLDGAQANAGAGTGSPGTGSATMTLDDASNLFSWDISWGGLTAPETVMHFHGPAPAGQNAGVQVNFGLISGTTSPSIGSTTITAAQAADLTAGLWYLNIHTTTSPGGEIRGQVSVVPEPASTGLVAGALALGTVWVVRRRRTR